MADAYRGLSRWDQASSAFQACIGIYHDLADQLEEARAKIRYALVFRDQFLSEQAIPLLTAGLQAVRELGDRRWEARAIRQLAIVHRNDGDTATAITMLAECMSIFGELEDRRGMAVVFRNRGDAERLAGNLHEAGNDLSNALAAFQAIGDRRWIARTQLSIPAWPGSGVSGRSLGSTRTRRWRLSVPSATGLPRQERSASWACCSATRAT